MAAANFLPIVGKAHFSQRDRVASPRSSFFSAAARSFPASLSVPLFQSLSNEETILQLLYKYSAGFNPVFL